MDEAPGVLRRWHRIPAFLLGCGSKNLVELVVEGEKVLPDIVFPVAEPCHFHGVGELLAKLSLLLFRPFVIRDVGSHAAERDRLSLIVANHRGPAIHDQFPAVGGDIDHLAAPGAVAQRLIDNFALGRAPFGIFPVNVRFLADKRLPAPAKAFLRGLVHVGYHSVQVRNRHMVVDLIQNQRTQLQFLLLLLFSADIPDEADKASLLALPVHGADFDIDNAAVLPAMRTFKPVVPSIRDILHAPGHLVGGFSDRQIFDFQVQKLGFAVADHPAIGLVYFQNSTMDVCHDKPVHRSFQNGTMFFFTSANFFFGILSIRDIFDNAFEKSGFILCIAHRLQVQVRHKFAAVLAAIAIQVMRNAFLEKLLRHDFVSFFGSHIYLFAYVMDFFDDLFGGIIAEHESQRGVDLEKTPFESGTKYADRGVHEYRPIPFLVFSKSVFGLLAPGAILNPGISFNLVLGLHVPGVEFGRRDFAIFPGSPKDAWSGISMLQIPNDNLLGQTVEDSVPFPQGFLQHLNPPLQFCIRCFFAHTSTPAFTMGWIVAHDFAFRMIRNLSIQHSISSIFGANRAVPDSQCSC